MAADSKSQTFAEVETLDGRKLRVEIQVNPRARNISVRIDPTRRLAIATSPSQRQVKRTHAFVAERAGWIARELSALPHAAAFTPFGRVPLRGAMHELIYEQGRGVARIEEGERIVAPAPDADLFGARVLRFLRAEAERDFRERVAVHAAALAVNVRRVQIKEMRSRWGSCSIDGVLAFSWRVIMAPPFVLDYLAAHEVAHLKEMNHSARFWAVVAKLCPEHEKGRAWLRRFGADLHAFGA